jgi:hypothetical protein
MTLGERLASYLLLRALKPRDCEVLEFDGRLLVTGDNEEVEAALRELGLLEGSEALLAASAGGQLSSGRFGKVGRVLIDRGRCVLLLDLREPE